MTVETSDRKQTFTGGQSSLVFAFRTLVSNPEYIQVKNVFVSSGVETDLNYGVDYTVAVDTDGEGGTVTLSPTFSTSYNHVVYRITTPVQASDYDDFNQFPANTVENDFDRGILIAQEISEETERTLRYPISASGASTELPAPVANAFLQWNPAANALINAVIPDPSTLLKASTAEAQAGVEDTHYMTPAKTADAIAALAASVSLTKATKTVAEGAANDTDYMTPLQVKNELQKASSMTIPSSNLTLLVAPIIGTTTPAAGKFTTLEATTTLKLGTTHQGDLLYDNGTSLVRLPPGTAGDFLQTRGASANPIWATPSTSSTFSSVVFQYQAVTGVGNDVYGEGVSTAFSTNPTSSYRYLFGPSGDTNYRTVLTGKFKKVSGYNTITVYSEIWITSTAGGDITSAKFSIGSATPLVLSCADTDTGPTWFNGTIDISALVTGTVYDISVSISKGVNNNSNPKPRIGSIFIFQ